MPGNRKQGQAVSRSRRPGIVTRVFAWFLWLYALGMAFIWFGARFVPEPGVSIRIAASAVSDLLWYLPGLVFWFMAGRRVLIALAGEPGLFGAVLRNTAVLLLATLLIVFFPGPAFRILFIPVLFLILHGVRRLLSSKTRPSPTPHARPLTAIIALILLYYGFQLFPRLPAPEPAGSLTVLTYNIFQDADNEERRQVISLIERESPDIACLVEVQPGRDESLFRRELGSAYPHQLKNTDTRNTRSTFLVLSKYPVARRSIDLRSNDLGFADFGFFTIASPEGPVTLVMFHLLTVGHFFERIHHREGDFAERLNETAEREADIDAIRYRQVTRISAVLDTLSGPVILCGDMNDTPNSRVYQVFSERFEDTFGDAGWGLGSSFGEKWMLSKPRIRNLPYSQYLVRDLIRIDYIFANDRFESVTSRVIGNAAGSDHKPVVSRLRILP